MSNMSAPMVARFRSQAELDDFLEYPKYVTISIVREGKMLILTYYEMLD
jgi:hypothetical protein